eukprot:3223992-Prymnesium_polylepis.1
MRLRSLLRVSGATATPLRLWLSGAARCSSNAASSASRAGEISRAATCCRFAVLPPEAAVVDAGSPAPSPALSS